MHLRQRIETLRPGKDLVSYEDYQRNFELSHMELPTSMAYAANAIQLGMYPIGLKFRRTSLTVDPPPVENGAIIFLTPDLHHNAQQVEKFGKRYLHIVAPFNDTANNCFF